MDDKPTTTTDASKLAHANGALEEDDDPAEVDVDVYSPPLNGNDKMDDRNSTQKTHDADEIADATDYTMGDGRSRQRSAGGEEKIQFGQTSKHTDDKVKLHVSNLPSSTIDGHFGRLFEPALSVEGAKQSEAPSSAIPGGPIPSHPSNASLGAGPSNAEIGDDGAEGESDDEAEGAEGEGNEQQVAKSPEQQLLEHVLGVNRKKKKKKSVIAAMQVPPPRAYKVHLAWTKEAFNAVGIYVKCIDENQVKALAVAEALKKAQRQHKPSGKRSHQRWY